MPARARPALVIVGALGLLAACRSAPQAAPPPLAPIPATSTAQHSKPVPSATSRPAAPTRPATTPHRPSPRAPSPTHPSPVPVAPRGESLPLGEPTGAARQVVTVVAGAESDTQGTLRAWRRVRGGWLPYGPAVPAWLGYDGMSPAPSESRSATPMGSFTLTQAFGRDPDPGTALPYLQTTPADWWISQAGPYYNTEQRCAAACPFVQGSPNEHLYDETPYYDYAAVIDYNTRNSPTGVRQGAGSAFFLHVAVGTPTQGCVAIPADQLVRILRWLRPAEHPRILIGLA